MHPIFIMKYTRQKTLKKKHLATINDINAKYDILPQRQERTTTKLLTVN